MTSLRPRIPISARVSGFNNNFSLLLQQRDITFMHQASAIVIDNQTLAPAYIISNTCPANRGSFQQNTRNSLSTLKEEQQY